MTGKLLQRCVERDATLTVERAEKKKCTDFSPEAAARHSHSMKGPQSVTFQMARAMRSKDQGPAQVRRARGCLTAQGQAQPCPRENAPGDSTGAIGDLDYGV